MRILTDLFDTEINISVTRSDSIGRVILSKSLEHGDRHRALEVLRELSILNLRDKDSLDRLLRSAEHIEQTDTSLGKETSTFIRMAVNIWFNNNAGESERLQRFEQNFGRWNTNPPTDLYEQIVLLYSVCLSLSQSGTTDILKTYTDKLGRLIDRLPPGQYSIRNVYYAMAGANYYRSGNVDAGLRSDNKFLSVMDSIEVDYRRRRRMFRNCDSIRYNVYCRILSNYASLSPRQVKRYYRLATECRKRNPENITSPRYDHLVDLYHLVASDKYEEAYPHIQSLFEIGVPASHRRKFLEIAIKTAEATGDKDMLIKSMASLNSILNDNLYNGMTSKDRLMHIIYDVKDMNNDLTEMQLRDIESNNERKTTTIIMSVVIILLLVITVIIVVIMYRRARRLTRSLSKANAALSSESQRLILTQGKLTRARDEAREANQLKSDFVRNMGIELTEPVNAIVEYSRLIVDCADAYSKEYLSRYADMVTGNCTFLSAVLDDIFHLSESNNNKPVIMRRELTDIDSLLRLAADTIRPSVAEGVTVEVRHDSEKVVTMADPTRLMQILLNLLRNSAAATAKGHITLSCGLVNDKSKVAISVTDTGSGVPEDIADKIFERGVISRNASGRFGLGLPVSRMIARLMGGEIIHDTSYTDGARFVFTFPFSITK